VSPTACQADEIEGRGTLLHGRSSCHIVQRIGDDSLASACERRPRLAKTSKILTDNGSQFTDRFATKDKKPSGGHAFDVACTTIPAEHRLAPRHPQTNGMVERFNSRINELLQQTRFDSRADLEMILLNYLKLHKYHIPQRHRRQNTHPGAQGMAKEASRAIRKTRL
jgi:transposase InsO family protein